MIRPFHLRDLPLIHRLSESGTSLHTEFSLTNHPHRLRNALISMMGIGEYPTYVWKDRGEHVAGFVQLHLEDSSHAHIVYASLTPEKAGDEPADQQARLERVWLPLLEQLTVVIGQCGIHSLVAEVGEEGQELLLRRSGFAVYTRQDVWAIDAVPDGKRAPIAMRQSIDDWDIQLLYANTVPRLVQLVEPSPPLDSGIRLVLREGSELASFVHMHDGPAGTWMRVFIHPHAETRAEAIVTAALALYPPDKEKPTYCCVRRYQSWLQSGLEHVGFHFYGSQAVMVKHTVQRTQTAAADLATLLDAKGVKGQTPLIQRYVTQPPAPLRHPEARRVWHAVHSKFSKSKGK